MTGFPAYGQWLTLFIVVASLLSMSIAYSIFFLIRGVVQYYRDRKLQQSQVFNPQINLQPSFDYLERLRGTKPGDPREYPTNPVNP